MNLIKAILLSSIGRKYIMAITGVALAAFVFVHLLGNLQLFLGADALNKYAVLLKSNFAVLWGYRLGLGTIALVHIVVALSLWVENRAARPVKYVVNTHPYADFASKMMVLGGVAIFFFVIWHILDLTAGAVRPELTEAKTMLGEKEVTDVYHVVLKGIGHPIAGFFYLVATCFLALHLWHGLESLLQSLGLRNSTYQLYIRLAARAAVIFLFAGMSLIPIVCMLGILK
ncbi:MAG: succinate dehydrogenase cytochrome b subunit [Clostridia bacterium]|nr:succinate dehydrogenase cytochrome b subunit [Verrucomicrobiota bacterium]NCC83612.1 succinate dehydrogenase cytochrome b subunit [Clostridia bacterium]